MKTTLMLGLQMLDRLEILHNLGYVYGDMKPDNFLVGLGNDSPFVFMVDFGRCKRYRNKVNGQHILYKENTSYTFNPIFASINSHNNIQASRRDDMESFVYVLTYLKLGKLPWAKASDVAVYLARWNVIKASWTSEKSRKEWLLRCFATNYQSKSSIWSTMCAHCSFIRNRTTTTFEKCYTLAFKENSSIILLCMIGTNLSRLILKSTLMNRKSTLKPNTCRIPKNFY